MRRKGKNSLFSPYSELNMDAATFHKNNNIISSKEFFYDCFHLNTNPKAFDYSLSVQPQQEIDEKSN